VDNYSIYTVLTSSNSPSFKCPVLGATGGTGGRMLDEGIIGYSASSFEAELLFSWSIGDELEQGEERRGGERR
jgi:hypothetical protein